MLRRASAAGMLRRRFQPRFGRSRRRRAARSDDDAPLRRAESALAFGSPPRPTRFVRRSSAAGRPRLLLSAAWLPCCQARPRSVLSQLDGGRDRAPRSRRVGRAVDGPGFCSSRASAAGLRPRAASRSRSPRRPSAARQPRAAAIPSRSAACPQWWPSEVSVGAARAAARRSASVLAPQSASRRGALRLRRLPTAGRGFASASRSAAPPPRQRAKIIRPSAILIWSESLR